MAKENNALLIFDFDNTITNGHMHNAFSGRYSGLKKSDFNSGMEHAVTDLNIQDFLKNTGGIKNEETLKSVLQSALSNGVEVNIASYTGYPNAVKRVVENHLGLSKKQTDSVSVFGGFPADYDTQLPRQDVREQQSQVGKNLHVCRAIGEYKNKHNGQLPKTVMLVDDSVDNIKRINEFVESMSKREGWLKENGLNIEDIQKIKFEGVQVPMSKGGEVVGDENYLGKVQKFIDTSLIQEPIYQNLQGIRGLPPEEELSPPLPPKKRKSSDGVDGKNKKQDIKPSETQAKPTRSKRHAVMFDPQQIESIFQNTEESLPGKKYAHTQTFSLFREIDTIRKWFKDCAKEIIDAACNLFKKAVVTKLKEQGYTVSSQQGDNGVIVNSNELIYASKINKDVIIKSLAQIMESKEKIKDLGNSYKGEQLGQEISKLLNADFQKENINPNSIGENYNNGEPTHQTREEVLISHQQIRGNYNDGEPTHQTVQEARNYHQQKRGINPNSMSKKPLAPPLPPKSRMEEVKTEGKTKTIEKS